MCGTGFWHESNLGNVLSLHIQFMFWGVYSAPGVVCLYVLVFRFNLSLVEKEEIPPHRDTGPVIHRQVGWIHLKGTTFV